MKYVDITILITTEIEQESTMKPMQIKLKAIEIPHFHGDYIKWIGF